MIKKGLGILAICISFCAAENSAVLYKQCAGCHGEDGKHKAFGRSAVIAGQSKDKLLEKLSFFRNGSDEAEGTSKVMKKQLKNLSKKELEALAEYISKL